MDHELQLLQLEEQFWKRDADFYREHLADEALMVFDEPRDDGPKQAIRSQPDGYGDCAD